MSEFRKVPLGEILHFKKGINYTSNDYGNEDNGVPFITIKCFKKGGGYEKTGLKYFKGNFNESDILIEGDVLFSVTDLTRAGDIVGSPLRVPDYGKGRKALASMDLMKVEPKDGECVREYIYYCLMRDDIRQKMVAYSAGSTVLHLDTKRVPEFIVTIPEKFIQRKIAHILSTIDAVIEKTEAAIAKYKAIKQGMMADLFTRGIDLPIGKLRPRYADVPEMYKPTELGWMPKEWEVVRIGNFSNIKGGKRLPAGREFSDSETPFPYLRVTDMVDGTINQADLKYVPIDIEPIIKTYKISIKDVYVTIAGTLGLFGTIPENLDNAQLTENAARITDFDSSQINRDYIKHQCNSEVIQSQVNREIGVGGGVPKLALFRIARFSFIKPDIDEQLLIVTRINKAENLIQKELTNLKKQISIKQALMSDLLTGRIRVQYEEEKAEVV